MRSSAGVGITPPNVPETPYPWSSVMMRSTLGAPLGGTILGGHQGVESLALSLITPPNFGGGDGICLPSIVVVALGEPGVPVTCCPYPFEASVRNNRVTASNRSTVRSPLTSVGFIILCWLRSALVTKFGEYPGAALSTQYRSDRRRVM